jgi:hypothetical protein
VPSTETSSGARTPVPSDLSRRNSLTS